MDFDGLGARETMSQRLTKTAVEAIAPGPRDVFMWDAAVAGFGVKVTPKGRRVYIVQYKDRARVTKRVTLGVHGDLTVDEARRRAVAIRGAVAGGADPAKEKRDAKAAARAERAASKRFEDVVDEFIESDQKQRGRRAWRVPERNLKNHVVPRWRGRDIREIRRADVYELLDALHADGLAVGASRVLAAVRRLFYWAVDRGLLDASPAARITLPHGVKRERVLTDVEILAVWRGAEALGGPFGVFVRFLLATAQRRTEAAGLQWTDIDFDTAVWTLPATLTKANRTHDVPLNGAALTLLEGVPRGARGQHVFTTTGGLRPISGFSKAKARLDTKIVDLVAAGDLDASILSRVDEDDPDAPPRMEPWTLHDLRRTATTRMAAAGVPRSTVKRVLNHADSGVTAIYDRHSYLPEKRQALDLWSGILLGLVQPDVANVIPFETVRDRGPE